jgi:hypothetical protein
MDASSFRVDSCACAPADGPVGAQRRSFVVRKPHLLVQRLLADPAFVSTARRMQAAASSDPKGPVARGDVLGGANYQRLLNDVDLADSSTLTIHLIANVDGVAPFTSVSGSVWPLVCAVAERPPAERYKVSDLCSLCACSLLRSFSL